MMLQDVHGHELTGATEVAAAHFERGTHELRCFIGDPVASADRAIAAAPDFVMAHALKGYLYGLSTEAGAQPVVEACHAAASRVAATPRERGHVAALGHLAQGRWHEAGKVLADLADAYPRDALALQAGHQVDFFTGNAPMLRARIEKALPHWDETLPGYHALLGMHAFGLEENADYAAAESAGRRAVDQIAVFGGKAGAFVLLFADRRKERAQEVVPTSVDGGGEDLVRHIAPVFAAAGLGPEDCQTMGVAVLQRSPRTGVGALHRAVHRLHDRL